MSDYLQGRFVVPVSYKVRLIEGIEGGAITEDVTFAAGETFASVDAILKKFNDVLTDSVFAVDTSTGKIVWTPGGSLTAIVHIFDQDSSGDTTLRDFLGGSSNYAGSVSAITFPNPHTAGFYPQRGFSNIAFVEHSIPRAARLLYARTGESQWGPESSSPRRRLALQLFMSSLSENESLETFFDSVLEGHGEPFAIINGSRSYSAVCADQPIELNFDRVSDHINTLWTCDLETWV